MVEIPADFARGVAEREGEPGRVWIDSLPDLIDEFLHRWQCTPVEPSPKCGALSSRSAGSSLLNSAAGVDHAVTTATRRRHAVNPHSNRMINTGKRLPSCRSDPVSIM